MSKYQDEIIINDAILTQAERDVPSDPQMRNTSHLYYDDATGKPRIDLQYGDNRSAPPNGATLVGSGATFPVVGIDDGSYFLRTDFTPNRLFRKSGTRWIKISDDNQKTWAAANRALTSFINNDTTFAEDGESRTEKTNLSKVIKPRTDD